MFIYISRVVKCYNNDRNTWIIKLAGLKVLKYVSQYLSVIDTPQIINLCRIHMNFLYMHGKIGSVSFVIKLIRFGIDTKDAMGLPSSITDSHLCRQGMLNSYTSTRDNIYIQPYQVSSTRDSIIV